MKNQEFFKLLAQAVKDGVSYVQTLISSDRYIPRYRDYPTLEWKENGLPSFSTASDDHAPHDYGEALSASWKIFGIDDSRKSAEDFPSFAAVTNYARNEPGIAEYFHLNEAGEEHYHFFRVSIEIFIRGLVNEYAHQFGFDFVESNFIELYKWREAAIYDEQLKIKIAVPIVLMSFEDDFVRISDDVSIERMDESTQLARIASVKASAGVREAVMEAASHCIVFRGYHIENQGFYRLAMSLYTPTIYPLHLIDGVFGAIRLFRHIDVGYAQILAIPEGWTRSYKAPMKTIFGASIRRYPPAFDTLNLFEPEVPKLSRGEGAVVAKIAANLLPRVEDTENGDRLALSIRRLNRCLLREDEDDSILDAAIGLESLLASDSDSEITYRLAMRAAALSRFFPTEFSKSPTEVLNEIKSVYKFRSAVAHGNVNKQVKTRELSLKNAERVSAVSVAINYLRHIIRVFLDRPELLEAGAIDTHVLLSSGEGQSEAS